ncbi:MAG: hypothetical protein WAN65_24570 [Candidatus Sulfotelmatobacter sp.]
MTSYFALAVAFLMTIAGIVGKTWDTRRQGLQRLTKTGLAVVLLAVASLTIGVLEIRKKDAEIRDIHSIRHIANRQVLDAANYLTRLLLAERLANGLDNKAMFTAIEDPANLSKLGQYCLVDPGGALTADGYGGVGGSFEQPWQLYAFDIDHGRRMLDDVIVKYGSFIEPTLMLRINDVLADDFFVNRFPLTRDKSDLDLALAETKESITCSGWGTLGHFYFYFRGRDRPPDYRPLLTLMGKIRALVDYASEQNTMRVFGDK